MDPEFFKPEIFFTATEEIRNPYVDLRISLVNTGTTNPAVLNELVANFLDVDGNGRFQEFNRFDTPASYTFDDPKDIAVENTGGGLLINGGTTEYTGISNVNPQVNVAVEFVNISTFVFRFGINAAGTSEFTTDVARQSGIQFSCLDNFINPQTITFNTDIATSKTLAEKIPNDFVKVSESGISDPKIITGLKEFGFQGFLIGENFMKTENPGEACQEFISQIR